MLDIDHITCRVPVGLNAWGLTTSTTYSKRFKPCKLTLYFLCQRVTYFPRSRQITYSAHAILVSAIGISTRPIAPLSSTVAVPADYRKTGRKHRNFSCNLPCVKRHQQTLKYLEIKIIKYSHQISLVQPLYNYSADI